MAMVLPKPKAANTMADLQQRDFWSVVVGGFLLSGVAGFINAATMVGLFTTTVSHLTGTTTRMAVTLVQNKWDDSLRQFTIILGFGFGSFICGIIVRSNKFRLTRRYGVALLLECVALSLTMVALYFENYSAPVIAAFACGLQNGLTSGYSGAIVRTTHVTGTVTDIGLIIGQNLLTETRQDLWKLKVLIPLLIGYWLGGFVGTVAYVNLDYLCFIIPTVFVGVLGLIQIAIQTYFIHKHDVIEHDKAIGRARAKRAIANSNKKKAAAEEAAAAAAAAAAPPQGSSSSATATPAQFVEVYEMTSTPLVKAASPAAAAATDAFDDDFGGALDSEFSDNVPLVVASRQSNGKSPASPRFQHDDSDDEDGPYRV